MWTIYFTKWANKQPYINAQDASFTYGWFLTTCNVEYDCIFLIKPYKLKPKDTVHLENNP